MIEDTVSTMDECFEGMEEVTYGSRILAKVADDQPSDDPRYETIFQEEMNTNRIIKYRLLYIPKFLVYCVFAG